MKLKINTLTFFAMAGVALDLVDQLEQQFNQASFRKLGYLISALTEECKMVIHTEQNCECFKFMDYICETYAKISNVFNNKK